ncbi:MAG TPA: 50S ribosomal protein L7/L12 [bacterium]|nr:50S ribosomal protein L7/L12 [bacterium]
MPTLTKDEFISAIEQMSVLELNELVKALETKFGVSAAAPVAVAAGGGAAAAAAEEKTAFDVNLKAVDAAKKINVIKVVREVTGLGLKKAKDLVDAAPKPIKTGVTKAEADGIVAKFKDSGAEVEIK